MLFVRSTRGHLYNDIFLPQIAQNYKDDFSFAVANNNDFNHEIEEFGLTYVSGDKPVICARDADGLKFIMKEDFR